MNYDLSKLNFNNLRHKKISFNEVCDHLLDFINMLPNYTYKLSVGSDSQVNSECTMLVTAIHLHRVGRGATGFVTSQMIPRPIYNLREKIFYETSATMQIASLFTPEIINSFLNPLLQTKFGDINFEFHLDVGRNGATKDLIKEMVAMANVYPFKPKIKPESYAASAYANKHTKKINNKK